MALVRLLCVKCREVPTGKVHLQANRHLPTNRNGQPSKGRLAHTLSRGTQPDSDRCQISINVSIAYLQNRSDRRSAIGCCVD